MAVTLITVVVYLGIFIPLLVIHETVPSAPTNPTLYRGLNISEAWLDLAELTSAYHPFNSRRNDEVREWLLMRIEDILGANGVSYTAGGQLIDPQPENKEQSEVSADQESPVSAPSNEVEPFPKTNHEELRARFVPSAAVIFNDLLSNYTSTALTKIGVSGRRAGISTYFEGNNIIVYIRGTEDEEGDWWTSARIP